MFSNTIKITTIDDFITPSQNCIKPLLVAKESQPKISTDEIIEVYKEIPTKPDLIKSKANKTATVTLNDCLACSGCVTTAETILIQQQGVDEILQKLKEKNLFPVFSISPQSRVSLALHLNKNERDFHEFLFENLKKLGVKHLFDMNLALDLAVILSCEEFADKFNKEKKPVICSECPGWVCYAEKVAGESVVPFMSSIKSPQQIMGKILKDFLSVKLNIQKDQIYHVAVMPCYDKKLEAVRPENNKEYKEVDTVISTHEIIDLLKKISQTDNNENQEESKTNEIIYQNQSADFFKNHDFEAILSEFYSVKPQENIHKTAFKQNCLEDGTSNSYLFHIIRFFSETILKEPKIPDIQIKKGKNSDLTEYILKTSQGTEYIFAKLYGLRNIQNFIRTLKKGPSKYVYIEMMACPGGCLNGGGQMKSKDLKNKELLEKLNQILHDTTYKTFRKPWENESIKLIEKFYGENSKKTGLKEIFSTNFHAIEKYEDLNW